MKHEALFPYKDNSKKIKCRLLQFLFGALRVNRYQHCQKAQQFSTVLYIGEYVQKTDLRDHYPMGGTDKTIKHLDTF